MEYTAGERTRGQLTGPHLKHALTLLRETGYVVLERALPVDWIAEMSAAFEQERKQWKEPERVNAEIEKAKGHYGFPCHLRLPYLSPFAIENALTFQIVDAALGPDVCAYLPYGYNATWPGSGVQHIHRDTIHVFKGEPSVRTTMPAGSLVVRDMRAWHRGMPNQTKNVRIMLALVYFRPFYNMLNLKHEKVIPTSVWEGFSDRVRPIYRHHPVG